MTSVRDGHMSFETYCASKESFSFSIRKGTLMTTRRGNGNGERGGLSMGCHAKIMGLLD